MTDAVLPGRITLVVVREPRPDELTDSVEGEALVWRLDDRHGDHGDVAVRWLDVLTLCVRCSLRPHQINLVTFLLEGIFF